MYQQPVCYGYLIVQNRWHNKTPVTENFCGYDREKLGMEIRPSKRLHFPETYFRSKELSFDVARRYVGFNEQHYTNTYFVPSNSPLKSENIPRRLWYIPSFVYLKGYDPQKIGEDLLLPSHGR